MSRSSARPLSMLLLLALAPATWACGPYFDTEYSFSTLLTRPEKTLGELQNGLFDFEHAGAFAEPESWERAEEDRRQAWQPSGAVSTEAQEQAELGDLYPRVQAMRAASDEPSAWAAGEGLTPEVRHYAAGARAFKAGDLKLARSHFESVLTLSARQRRLRTLWAQFMLGRVALAEARTLDGKPRERQAAAAMKSFERLRKLAAGQPDPQQLVRGSLGEEAAAAMLVGDYVRAARRYEQQAELGSTSGKLSLSILAQHLLNDSDRLQVAMRDPLLQRLVTAYLRTSTPWRPIPTARRTTTIFATSTTSCASCSVAACSGPIGRARPSPTSPRPRSRPPRRAMPPPAAAAPRARASRVPRRCTRSRS